MNNEEVQAKAKTKTKPGKIRTSIIRKSIQRTLSTAKYESIVIHDELEETIEWSSLSERDKKIRNWDTLLIKSFKQTHDEILKELNLTHKQAFFKDNLAEKDYRAEPGQQSELDGLDELE